MTFYHRSSDRKRIFHDYPGEDDDVSSFCRSDSRPISAKSIHEQEKRIRREIANSNERRRMQNINAGLQSLKALLPHREGEKLSKVAILQSAAEYVYQLEQDKSRLLEQNSQMSRRMLNSPNRDSDGSCSDSPVSKRKRRKTVDSMDEGIGSSSSSRSDNGADDLKQEILELRIELEHERALRILLEEQIRNLESRLSQVKKESNTVEQTVKSSILVMNLGHESGLSSPQSQISSQDVESSHEMSLQGSSPELSSLEILNHSQKNCTILLPSADEQSIAGAVTIPGLLMPTSLLNASFPVENNGPPQPAVYKVSRSRQNLETIVEAIKHVEGLDVFHGDSKSVESE